MIDRSPLDVVRVRAAAGPSWPRIDLVAETASTNADLLADASAPDRSVLVAELQSAGRGRFERAWTSPPRAGLTFSVLLRPQVPTARWGWLPLLSGVALAEAVTEVTGLEATLKWPNDLLVGGRKAAGILAQSAGEVAVVGIGLNVSLTRGELPAPTATSLALEDARTLNRATLLAQILTRLDLRVTQWTAHGGDARAGGLLAAYRAVCATVGADVRVSVAGGSVLEGQATGVDDTGRIVIRTATGERSVGAGDVEHLRPSG